MIMKCKKTIINKKPSTLQRVQLALAFVGEHKEEFISWLKSKGLDYNSANDEVDK